LRPNVMKIALFTRLGLVEVLIVVIGLAFSIILAVRMSTVLVFEALLLFGLATVASPIMGGSRAAQRGLYSPSHPGDLKQETLSRNKWTLTIPLVILAFANTALTLITFTINF